MSTEDWKRVCLAFEAFFKDAVFSKDDTVLLRLGVSPVQIAELFIDETNRLVLETQRQLLARLLAQRSSVLSRFLESEAESRFIITKELYADRLNREELLKGKLHSVQLCWASEALAPFILAIVENQPQRVADLGTRLLSSEDDVLLTQLWIALCEFPHPIFSVILHANLIAFRMAPSIQTEARRELEIHLRDLVDDLQRSTSMDELLHMAEHIWDKSPLSKVECGYFWARLILEACDGNALNAKQVMADVIEAKCPRDVVDFIKTIYGI